MNRAVTQTTRRTAEQSVVGAQQHSSLHHLDFSLNNTDYKANIGADLFSSKCICVSKRM